MVYKLVEIGGVPKIKLSDEIEKASLPGKKKVYRVTLENGRDNNDSTKPSFDVICLDEEELTVDNNGGSTIRVWVPFKEDNISVKPFKIELMTELLIENGKPVIDQPSIQDRRKACMEEFRNFGGAERLLKDDKIRGKEDDYDVYLSDKLNTVLKETLARLKFE